MIYDLIVIGAGWAGFNAALKAAKLGKKVCLIEERELGGTCLNRGCIPTKAFVACVKQGFSLVEFQKKRDTIVERLRSGMEYLLKAHKVDYIRGRARIKTQDSVILSDGKAFKTKFILVATGSGPKELPHLAIDNRKVISSDDALCLKEAPRNALIVGAGAVGCEFACIFKQLGAEVTVVEIAGQLLPGIDAQVSKKLLQNFQKMEINVFLGKKAEDLDLAEFDKILLSIGRQGRWEGVWGDEVPIRAEKGVIRVDERLRTNVKNIFCAGDCVGGQMLAHVASYEGELAVNNMFLKAEKRDYGVIPSSIFTSPEIGVVGISEEQAKGSGAPYKVLVVHYLSNGMAHILGDTQGFVKVIAHKNGFILGAAIIGLEASELINIFSMAMKNKITLPDLKKTVFAHPAVSEIVSEVARSF